MALIWYFVLKVDRHTVRKWLIHCLKYQVNQEQISNPYHMWPFIEIANLL